MDNIRTHIARHLLSIGAVFLRPDEPFVWASGIKSPIYCDNRLILTIQAIAAQRHEPGERQFHIITEMGPRRVARHLGLLPWRQRLVRAGQQFRRLAFQTADFGRKVQVATLCGIAKLGNAGFERGDRLFEFEVGNHETALRAERLAVNLVRALARDGVR